MKKNNFFKALGVGAVATLGLFTMAGCSLSDTEKADVMEGLENANTYMEETIDLLKEQNKKLNEQNQELNEQNQLLRDQNETASDNLGESEKTNTTLTAYLEELKKQVKALEDSLKAEQDENEILGDNLTESQKTNTTLTAYLEELKKQVKALEDSLKAEQDENEILGDNLTESQKTNTTLTAYLEELKKQVKALEDSLKAEQDENEILQNYLQELQNENAQITVEEAYNKLMIAKANLETNNNGIRNNIRVICVSTDGVFTGNQTVELYKTENNGYVSNVILDDYYSGLRSNLCYEDENKVYEYIKDLDAEGNFVDYTKEVRADLLSSESGSGLIYAMTPLFLDRLSADNIYSVEILENGNYKLRAIIESEFIEDDEDYYYNKQTYLLEYEITSDYKFISMNINQFNKTAEEVENGLVEEYSFTVSGSARIEYNTITEEYINELLQEAISKDPKAPEEE